MIMSTAGSFIMSVEPHQPYRSKKALAKKLKGHYNKDKHHYVSA